MSKTNLANCMKQHGRGKKHDYFETPEEQPCRGKLLRANERNKPAKRNRRR